MNGELIVQQTEFMPALTIDQARSRYGEMVKFVKREMKDGLDYGTVPGSAKPTLLKPGAEKLCTFFGLIANEPKILESVKDWTGNVYGEPFFYFEIMQTLSRNGQVVAAQFGSCNSWESKYRYRQGQRKCPNCGKETIIKGKEEYGGGWLCFAKKGGCNAKFPDGDKAIESQQVGRVANPDVADIVNTVQKMAQKRALIAAVLVATNASEFFTQDIDETIAHDQATKPAKTLPTYDPSVFKTWQAAIYNLDAGGYYQDIEEDVRALGPKLREAVREMSKDNALQLSKEYKILKDKYLPAEANAQ